MVSYRDFEALVIVLIMGVVGLIMAMLFGVLNDQGIIVDEFVSATITLTDLQAIVIIFWLVVGVIIAAVKK